jgi:hypothetical protein
MGLSKEAMVLIVICSAAVSVLLGFAVSKLCFTRQEKSPFQMSDQQVAYIRSVKDANMRHMMAEAGMGRYQQRSFDQEGVEHKFRA